MGGHMFRAQRAGAAKIAGYMNFRLPQKLAFNDLLGRAGLEFLHKLIRT
jgi:hypothetical protein